MKTLPRERCKLLNRQTGSTQSSKALREIREQFLATGEVCDLPRLRQSLETLEGPDRLLCRRLLLIADGSPDLNDPETRNLLIRRNARILASRFTDLSGDADT